MTEIKLRNFVIGGGDLVVMSGPCVIESMEHCLESAAALKDIFAQAGVHFIFKSSFDKANRSSLNAFRGPGLDEGLKILQRVKEELDLPIVCDIHTPEQALAAAEIADIIQIPAFLCRQTDLLIAAAQTGAIINVKKGQFMAPWDMKNVVEKLRLSGNDKIILVDRGTCFGYNNLISDMRAIPIMQSFDCPVCFDASHSVQLPGGLGNATGGQREYIPTLVKASIAAGVDCLFIESHNDPANAKSDASSVFDFKGLPSLLESMKKIHQACA
jgi:2-dehydro-3-deoxyphosphooctonate aldolase (KDO 8-P synthase)